MSTLDIGMKLVRRLKADGLVPKDKAVRILTLRSHSSPVKWEAVNAVTGEKFKVGGAGWMGEMWNREWTPLLEDEGWIVLIPGDKLPPVPPGGRKAVEGTGLRNRGIR